MTEILLQITFSELCQIEEISEQTIIEAVEHGIAKPVRGDEAEEWIFETGSAYWLKKAVRLHRDLDIDWVAVAVVIDLLQKNEELQKENQFLKDQFGRFL